MENERRESKNINKKWTKWGRKKGKEKVEMEREVKAQWNKYLIEWKKDKRLLRLIKLKER